MLDFGRNLPRLGLSSVLTTEIVDQAERQPTKAPPTSLGDYLFRAVHGITAPLPPGRWGD